MKKSDTFYDHTLADDMRAKPCIVDDSRNSFRMSIVHPLKIACFWEWLDIKHLFATVNRTIGIGSVLVGCSSSSFCI